MPSFLEGIKSWARSTSFYVVTFIDGEFETITEPFATKDAAALYSRGFVSGAGRLAVSSVRAFVLPDEHADLVEFGRNTGVDIKPALVAMAHALEAP